MIPQELLKKLGMSPEEIAEFIRLHELGRFSAQQKLLRKYRQRLLDGIHKNEKLIAELDYLLREIGAE